MIARVVRKHLNGLVESNVKCDPTIFKEMAKCLKSYLYIYLPPFKILSLSHTHTQAYVLHINILSFSFLSIVTVYIHLLLKYSSFSTLT